MNIVEQQARRALDRELVPGEIVRGFTLCEWNNGRVTRQAFASRSVDKGFFAFTDARVFLIPLRVRDITSEPFTQIDDIYTRGLDEFLTVKLDGDLSLDFIVNDPSVSTALLKLWSDYYQYAIQLFDQEFRTSDFDQRMLEEMDKQLGRGLSFDDAVRQVAIGVHQLVLRQSQDKSVATAGAAAALQVTRSHPAGVAAGTASGRNL